jgi:hypothetical protein
MSMTQVIATAIALLLGMALFAWVDREQPEELDDTEADRVKRYLADQDGDDEC